MAKKAQYGSEPLAQKPTSNKDDNTLSQRPPNYKPERPLALKPKPNKEEDQLNDAPSMMDYLQQLQEAIASGVNVATYGVSPVVAPELYAGKPNDQLNQPTRKPYDSLSNRMLAARSDQLRSAVRPAGGFGTNYGGNWSGYGGGGGGGGGYGDGSRPAWLNYLLNLYSWNIK